MGLIERGPIERGRMKRGRVVIAPQKGMAQDWLLQGSGMGSRFQ
jgi:hypothetical protein